VDPVSGQSWLFEATPDLPHQIRLLTKTVGSDEGLPSGIFLTHAHIGHYTGLMYLGREVLGANQVPVYAMPRMKSFLLENGPWDQLVRLDNIELRKMKADSAVRLNERLQVIPFQVPHRDEYSETVGFQIVGPSQSALFIPDIDKWGKWDRSIVELVREVDYAFLDATFFDADELPGRDMSEIPHPFVQESMETFQGLSPYDKEKIHFIHFNHTNPLLDTRSSASQKVIREGFRIARYAQIFGL
jgi:pyrroloquinoline quinone biosynthesis protein B